MVSWLGWNVEHGPVEELAARHGDALGPQAVALGAGVEPIGAEQPATGGAAEAGGPAGDVDRHDVVMAGGDLARGRPRSSGRGHRRGDAQRLGHAVGHRHVRQRQHDDRDRRQGREDLVDLLGVERCEASTEATSLAPTQSTTTSVYGSTWSSWFVDDVGGLRAGDGEHRHVDGSLEQAGAEVGGGVGDVVAAEAGGEAVADPGDAQRRPGQARRRGGRCRRGPRCRGARRRGPGGPPRRTAPTARRSPVPLWPPLLLVQVLVPAWSSLPGPSLSMVTSADRAGYLNHGCLREPDKRVGTAPEGPNGLRADD